MNVYSPFASVVVVISATPFRNSVIVTVFVGRLPIVGSPASRIPLLFRSFHTPLATYSR